MMDVFAGRLSSRSDVKVELNDGNLLSDSRMLSHPAWLGCTLDIKQLSHDRSLGSSTLAASSARDTESQWRVAF